MKKLHLPRIQLRELNRREKWLVFSFVALTVGFGLDYLIRSEYLPRHHHLTTSVAHAENTLQRNARLLANADNIRRQYRDLNDPDLATDRETVSDRDVLRQIEELATRDVEIKSVIPYLDTTREVPTLSVSLEFECPLYAATTFIKEILTDLPGDLETMSMTAQPGRASDIRCRASFRFYCHES